MNNAKRAQRRTPEVHPEQGDTSRTVRDLKEREMAALRARSERLQRAQQVLHQELQNWNELIDLVTDGDPALTVDLGAGTVVRKAAP